MSYATIVADPPWPLDISTPSFFSRSGERKRGDYPTMPLADIAAMPIADLAADDAHLYLWTVNRFLEDSFEIARAWGFRPASTLVWAKSPMGMLGGAYGSATEFILYCRRGKLPPLRREGRNWWSWSRERQRVGRGSFPVHSRKPHAFFEMVEEVSPGPYLELFARQPRPGWHVWGNEVQSDIALTA